MWNFGSRIVLLLLRNLNADLFLNACFKERNMVVGKAPQINGKLF